MSSGFGEKCFKDEIPCPDCHRNISAYDFDFYSEEDVEIILPDMVCPYCGNDIGTVTVVETKRYFISIDFNSKKE
jgi:C4-type Zn-finger protein